MAKIKGIDELTVAEIYREIENGGKFVCFQYTVSVVVMTFKRSSNIHFIKAGQSTFSKSIPFTLITLGLGWWGVPWGPIYSLGSIFTNLSGGKDLTNEVLKSFREGNKNDNPELLDSDI